MTLNRTWKALTWRQKLQLAREGFKLATSQLQMDANVIEQLKSDEAVSDFEAQMSQEFPEVRALL